MFQRLLAPLSLMSWLLAGATLTVHADQLVAADSDALSEPVTSDDPFLALQPVPEVLTATRLRQAPAAVPGSVTVIDRNLIRASGARDITTLLRLVPGMLVVPDANSTTVNYHGSSAGQARRMQVLVDGRSVYRSGFAQVDWSDIPVAIEDIERIEVFRGPNTVSYGANALMAVVNIITTEPADSQGTRLKITRGQRGIAGWYASHGSSWSNGDLRLSASGLEDDGFDERADGSDFRDSRRLDRLHLRAQQTLNAEQSLDWQIALKEGTTQKPNSYSPILPIVTRPDEQDADADVKARDYAASLRWTFEPSTEHSLYVQTNLQQWERLRQWRACDAQIAFSPELRQLWTLYSPAQRQLLLESGTLTQQTPAQAALASQVRQQLLSQLQANGTFAHTCGLINEDLRENRFDLELQDTLSISDDLRLLSGASYRHDWVDAETHLNGEKSRDIFRLFGHLEWYLSDHWLVQGGLMAEHDNSFGASLTPRAAVNYLITPAHGLRLVYSEAVRSADMFENDANWRYWVTDLQPTPYGQREAYFFMSALGPGNLEQEHMRSYEAGYNGRFTSLGLTLDVKLFREVIDDLISHEPKIHRFEPNNQSHLIFTGMETEVDWQAGVDDRLRLTYAYIQDDASDPLDQLITPRHSGSLAWLHDWHRGWSSSLIYQGADALNGYRFERMDMRLAKRIGLGQADLELAGVWQQRLDDEPLSSLNNRYDDRHVFYLSGELTF